MKRGGHHLLTVVVVDLHAVEVLEVLQVVGQEDDEVALEPGGKEAWLLNLVPLVGERLAAERRTAAERLEARQHLLSHFHLQALVGPLAVHQGRCVERQVRQPLPREVLLHGRDVAIEHLVLLVEHQGHDDVGRMAVLAARLVDEYAQLPGRKKLLKRKVPGDTPGHLVEANASKGFIPHEVFRINAFAMGSSNHERSGAPYWGSAELANQLQLSTWISALTPIQNPDFASSVIVVSSGCVLCPQWA